MNRAFGFYREIRGAVSGENDRCENRNRHCVPIEQPHIAARPKVSEKGHREIALSVERNAARHVACCGAKQDRQQEIREDENEIPKALPETVVDVATYFDRNTAQDEAP